VQAQILMVLKRLARDRGIAVLLTTPAGGLSAGKVKFGGTTGVLQSC
jgi:ABC-type microcin C transport system duplicated ATPase subunit YejF